MSIVNDSGIAKIVDDEIVLAKREYSDQGSNETERRNIFNLVRSFDLYETVDAHTTTANFVITDGVGLSDSYPIVGGEEISLAVKLPGEEKTISCKYSVDSIVDQQANDQGNLNAYTLACVSPEFIINHSKSWFQNLKGKEYSEIFDSLSPINGNFAVREETKGKLNHSTNGLRAFQIVDLIAEKAVCRTGETSHFYFWQSANEGKFNFASLNYLIENGETGLEYFYETANRASEYEKVLNDAKILKYEHVTHGSLTEKLKKGALSTRISEFDIFTGCYFTEYTYEYNEDSGAFTFTHAGAHQHRPDLISSLKGETHYPVEETVFKHPDDSRQFIDPVSQEVGRDIFVPAEPEDFIESDDKGSNSTIPIRRASALLLNQDEVRVRIYGNPMVEVGKIVTINLPVFSGVTEGETEQEYYSGKYLVTGIRHMFDRSKNDSNRFDYIMVLELRRPNMKQAVA